MDERVKHLLLLNISLMNNTQKEIDKIFVFPLNPLFPFQRREVMDKI